MIGSTGRRLRISITARIARVSPARIWLVVPNSGQMIMPPAPSAPALKARPRQTASTINVATSVPSFTPTTCPISWTTKRCRRTPVSIVVAANSTAMVARIVADSEVGMPRPAFRIAPPPVTKAATPPSLKAVYTASQSARVRKPAVVAMIAPRASSPSPTAPK